MKRFIIALSLTFTIFLLFGATCGRNNLQTGNETISSNNVVINNFSFNPQNITINRGTTVTWVNEESTPHTIASDGNLGALNSQTLNINQTYSFTFNEAGKFGYHCSIHPNMKGTVTVN